MGAVTRSARRFLSVIERGHLGMTSDTSGHFAGARRKIVGLVTILAIQFAGVKRVIGAHFFMAIRAQENFRRRRGRLRMDRMAARA